MKRDLVTLSKKLFMYENITHRVRAKKAFDAPILAIFEINPIRALALVMRPESAQLALVLWLVRAGEGTVTPLATLSTLGPM